MFTWVRTSSSVWQLSSTALTWKTLKFSNRSVWRYKVFIVTEEYLFLWSKKHWETQRRISESFSLSFETRRSLFLSTEHECMRGQKESSTKHMMTWEKSWEMNTSQTWKALNFSWTRWRKKNDEMSCRLFLNKMRTQCGRSRKDAWGLSSMLLTRRD